MESFFSGITSHFNTFPVFILILIGIIAFMLYFLPAWLGRKKENNFAIFLVNLFLGWSFIAWVICLVWALSAQRRN